MFQKVICTLLAGLEMRVTQIVPVLFRNSFFFVYRHSDLEVSCSNGTKTRHVNLGEGGFTLTLYQGWDVRVKYCWNRCSTILAFETSS